MNHPTRIAAWSAAALAALLAACAAPANDPNAAPKPVREYRTGSNIPVKDPTPAVSQEERDQTAEQVRRLQRGSPIGKPGG